MYVSILQKYLSRLGFEPGLSRSQREVLTTRLSRRSEVEYLCFSILLQDNLLSCHFSVYVNDFTKSLFGLTKSPLIPLLFLLPGLAVIPFFFIQSVLNPSKNKA